MKAMIVEWGVLDKSVLLSEKTTLDTLPAHKVVYTAEDGGITKK